MARNINFSDTGGRHAARLLRGWFILAAVLITLTLPRAVNAAPSWQVFRITDDSELDVLPAVSGTTYVCQRKLGNGAIIMQWSEGDSSPTQISTSEWDWQPRIEDGRVLWEANPGSDYDIWEWISGLASALTSGSVNERFPDIGGGATVWRVNTW